MACDQTVWFNLEHSLTKRLEWPTGLRRCERIGWFSVRNLLDTRPGLGTQSRFEAPGDLRVETKNNAVINVGVSEAAPSIMAHSYQ